MKIEFENELEITRECLYSDNDDVVLVVVAEQ